MNQKQRWLGGGAAVLILAGVGLLAAREPLMRRYQHASVTFKVTEDGRYDLQGATVTLDGADYLTDSHGKTSVADSAAGIHAVQVSLKGFVTSTASVGLKRGSNDLQLVSLSKEIVSVPTYGVQGYVQDSISGKPVEGVRVALGSASVTTDPAGEYDFKKQPAGKVKLLLSKDGYADKQLDLSIQSADVVTAQVPLVPAGQVVYVLTKDGRRQLYRAGYDGQSSALATGVGEAYSPAVSPDGKLVAFASTQDGTLDAFGAPVAKPYVMGIDGTGLRKISDEAFKQASWSPNSGWLFLQTAKSYGVYGLAKNGFVNLNEEAGGAVFSPDSATLAYYVYVDTADGYYNVLKTFSLATQAHATLGKQKAFMSDLRFSPDSALVSYEITLDGRHRYQDAVAGDKPEQEIPLPDVGGRHYSISPDNEAMAFVEQRDGKTDLYVADRSLAGERRLTDTGNLTAAVPSWDTSSRYLVFAQQGSLYVISAAGGTAHKLVDITN